MKSPTSRLDLQGALSEHLFESRSGESQEILCGHTKNELLCCIKNPHKAPQEWSMLFTENVPAALFLHYFVLGKVC